MMSHRPGPAVEIRRLDTDAGPVPVLVELGEPAAGEPRLGPSIGEYPVYDTALYATMTQDAARNELFRAALAALCPGRRVLDLGTGADLLWAVESHRAGARHVDAVEVIEQSYRAADRVRAGLAHPAAITLHHGTSTELALPDRVDVCVGEVIGSLAGAEGAAAVMADVRERLLTADGVIVPHRAVSLAAGASLRQLLGGRTIAFAPSTVPYLAGVFAAGGGPHDVRLRVTDPAAAALLTDHAEVESLDFNGNLRTTQEHEVSLTVRRPGVLDGLLTWLRLWCVAGGPELDALATRTNWASVFFPLFDEEIAVAVGDRLDVRLHVRPGEDGLHPDYLVTARLTTAAGTHEGRLASRHRGSAFRASRIHRDLFPVE
ncbi:MAG TPA: hypothetical protein VMB79_14310 [Jatrophihabitans sp.]|nr:hypothetical protein [Jatrophihabitans sp.]